MSKIELIIDGQSVSGLPKQTILQVARENGIEIPTLCYDDRMDIYGSCGLCVVEIEGNPKIFKSCATEISEGMVVKTNTDRVNESRKTNLELLMSKHIGDCVAPCKRACPGTTDCQGYVGLIANGEFEAALELLKEQLPFPGAIGRVCPHPCETACRRGEVDEPISIMDLKRFAADYDMVDEMFMPEIKAQTGKSVGIVGGGPAGLSAAYYLIQSGHSVTVYDKMPKMGGMLRYGIPEYRLPKGVVDEETDLIERMGVVFKNNVQIGKELEFRALRNSHDALYIAIGAWVSSGLRCDGVDADGVIGGIDLLRSVTNNEPFKIGEKVAIVGGGNTAMDACRTAVRLGAKKVYNIYRRTKAEMPAEEIEIIEAEEEGVIFKNLTNPLEIVKDESGTVSKIRLQKMELGEPDASGRRRPVAIEGQEEVLDVDTVVLAIGQGINPEGLADLELTKWNTILADETSYTTSLKGVFAGGDCINDGASIAIKAIGEAKKAVATIEAYLAGEEIEYHEPYYVTKEGLDPDDLEKIKEHKRPGMSHLAAIERKNNFLEIVNGFTEEQAIEEGSRCLECGCQDFFECKLFDYANQYQVEPERFKGKNLKEEIQDDHPFVIRDNNKCVTCGLCVRVCEDIIGVSALGLVDRGFDTLVEPALKQPLNQTGCISCGQCIAVCPTGALQEAPQGIKPVPYNTDKTDTTCAYCSMGCQMTVETMGNTIVKTVPQDDHLNDNKGIMCGRGRFGTGLSQQGERITQPLIRNLKGDLEEVSFYDAFVYTVKKVQGLTARYGKNAVKMAISPKYTNEELDGFIKLSDILQTEMFSFSNVIRGEEAVLGSSMFPTDADALNKADAIAVFGVPANPVLHYQLKKAQENGAEIFAFNPYQTGLDIFAEELVMEADDLRFIAEMLVYICNNTEKQGCDNLKDTLKGIVPTAQSEVFAEFLMDRNNILFIIGDAYINTSEAGAMIGNLFALVNNDLGNPASGIIRIPTKNNSNGLNLLGVTKTSDCLAGAKGLLNFGEDTTAISDDLEFLMVQDTHLTKTALKADVVIPASASTESSGSYINYNYQLMKCVQPVVSTLEWSNFEMVEAMAEIMGSSLKFAQTEISEQIKAQFGVENYNQTVKRNKNITDGVDFKPYQEGLLFNKAENTDYLMKVIEERLEKEIN
ncbi:FAD-dependent oxidoreductase [Eubacteriaceae bacterium ES3]|nr:FAD-dependent oxidoreductase [Eubacteriaceae bacterium ES3]